MPSDECFRLHYHQCEVGPAEEEHQPTEVDRHLAKGSEEVNKVRETAA